MPTFFTLHIIYFHFQPVYPYLMLEKAIKSAMEGNIVSEPPVAGGKLEVRRMPPPEITQNIVRVQMECDPVGFLMDVVKGTPIETQYVREDGEYDICIETPNIKQRIDAAKFLTRVIQPPKQHAHAHLHKTDDSWDKVLENTARKGR